MKHVIELIVVLVALMVLIISTWHSDGKKGIAGLFILFIYATLVIIIDTMFEEKHLSLWVFIVLFIILTLVYCYVTLKILKNTVKNAKKSK
jgi:uncharacterized protein (DUF983 family)